MSGKYKSVLAELMKDERQDKLIQAIDGLAKRIENDKRNNFKIWNNEMSDLFNKCSDKSKLITGNKDWVECKLGIKMYRDFCNSQHIHKNTPPEIEQGIIRCREILKKHKNLILD